MDNVISMVDGMVVGPQSYYEGPSAVASVIDRPVDPIGGQKCTYVQKFSRIGQLDMHRFPRIGPTVGGPTGRAV